MCTPAAFVTYQNITRGHTKNYVAGAGSCLCLSVQRSRERWRSVPDLWTSRRPRSRVCPRSSTEFGDKNRGPALPVGGSGDVCPRSPTEAGDDDPGPALPVGGSGDVCPRSPTEAGDDDPGPALPVGGSGDRMSRSWSSGLRSGGDPVPLTSRSGTGSVPPGAKRTEKGTDPEGLHGSPRRKTISTYISKERAWQDLRLERVQPMANCRVMNYRIMNINEVNDAFVWCDLLNKFIFYIIGKSNSWSTFWWQQHLSGVFIVKVISI